VPVRKKSPGRWRVTIWFRGERKEWIIQGTKDDARSFEARKRTEIERAARIEFRTVPTFYDFCVDKYVPHAKLFLKPSTWSIRRFQLASLIQFFGPMRMSAISADDIERYQRIRQIRESAADREIALASLREEERSLAVGASPSTVNEELVRFTTVMRFAHEAGFPVAIPKIRRLRRRPRGKVKFWTAAEVSRLLGSCQRLAPEILPMVFTIVHCGLRKGEAIRLRWVDVDFDQKLLHIWPHEADDDEDAVEEFNGGEAWAPKHDRAREVPFDDDVAGVLGAQKDRKLSDKWVFPSREGGAYAYFPKRQFALATKAAALTGGPHKLRHTFASLFLQRQPDLFLLAEILGHSSITTTKLYAHLMPDHLARGRGAVKIPMPPPVEDPGRAAE